jgi:hypothetical protein
MFARPYVRKHKGAEAMRGPPTLERFEHYVNKLISVPMKTFFCNENIIAFLGCAAKPFMPRPMTVNAHA